jgi:hypothetical protein
VLQLGRRGYDMVPGDAAPSEARRVLAKRVFLALLRMCVPLARFSYVHASLERSLVAAPLERCRRRALGGVRAFPRPVRLLSCSVSAVYAPRAHVMPLYFCLPVRSCAHACRLARVTTGERGGPEPAEQAALLYDRWLLDVPKLMDVAALYGAANGALARRFMRQADPIPACPEEPASLHVPASDCMCQASCPRCLLCCAPLQSWGDTQWGPRMIHRVDTRRSLSCSRPTRATWRAPRPCSWAT